MLIIEENVWRHETYSYGCLQSQHSSISFCSNCKQKVIIRTLNNSIKTSDDEQSTMLLRKLLRRFITLISFIANSCHTVWSLNLLVSSSSIRTYFCFLPICLNELSCQYFLANHKVTLKPCILKNHWPKITWK